MARRRRNKRRYDLPDEMPRDHAIGAILAANIKRLRELAGVTALQLARGIDEPCEIIERIEDNQMSLPWSIGNDIAHYCGFRILIAGLDDRPGRREPFKG